MNLASQMVACLCSCFSEEEDILNGLQYYHYRKKLANVIHTQMQGHYKCGYTEYELTVTLGFECPKMASVSYEVQEKARYFRKDVERRSLIRGMLFQVSGSAYILCRVSL